MRKIAHRKRSKQDELQQHHDGRPRRRPRNNESSDNNDNHECHEGMTTSIWTKAFPGLRTALGPSCVVDLPKQSPWASQGIPNKLSRCPSRIMTVGILGALARSRGLFLYGSPRSRALGHMDALTTKPKQQTHGAKARSS